MNPLDGVTPTSSGKPDLETTGSLVRRAQAGDLVAEGRLIARHLPKLQRWAHGRLPARARDLLETDDLVQLSLVKAFGRVKVGFEPRGAGTFFSYLRTTLQRLVITELRRRRARVVREKLDPNLPSDAPSPLELAIGRDRLARYERALARLPRRQRDAVVLRHELGFEHQEVADMIGLASANAARMLVARALVRIAKEMGPP